jgi:hypothetical protein
MAILGVSSLVVGHIVSTSGSFYDRYMEFENRGAGARLWQIGKLEVGLVEDSSPTLRSSGIHYEVSFISGLSHVQVTRWRCKQPH